ncbi:MAG: DNA methyltransferase [Dehalococcoidia bacterium]
MKNESNKLLRDFKEETTTLWSFPDRGNWATHNPEYRGNYAPQIPRNVILKYSEIGETVLDPMVGSGTTLIECKLLNRHGIGIDINPEAVELTRQAIDFEFTTNSKQDVYQADVRSLNYTKNNSIDLICTHPPYLNLVTYSKGKIEGDFSNIASPQKFCDELDAGIKEMYRVLKPNRYCAILVGDTRKAQHYVPLSYLVLQKFLQNGFALKEDIIKAQHNCVYSTRWITRAKQYGFYLIMHEHLFVFRKPNANEDLSRIRWSIIPSKMSNVIE